MKTNELIAILRDEDDPNVLDYIQEAADTLQLQKVRIMELETELKDERHRHDRYVDFELAEAAELARVKAERRWIAVTERKPDIIPCSAGSAYSEAVNVLTSGRKVLTAIWDGTDFIADAEFWEAENEEITHWTPVLLPLPEPPKEGA